MRIALWIAVWMGCTAFARAESALTPTGAGDFAPIAADASADQVLDALKARGDTMRDFSCDVGVTEVDEATADSSSHGGKVLFQKLDNGDGRIRVSFNQSTQGTKIFKEQHEYTLAKGWLIDRDYDKKNEVRRQVVRPGEKLNLLKLGEGPFPLPVGQDRADVKKEFDVTKVDAAKDDPADTVHLQLKPKAGSDFSRKFTQIDVWVDRTVGMPVRIVTRDSSGDRTQTTDLTHIRLNQGLGDADFTLPKVDGWDVTEEPYR